LNTCSPASYGINKPTDFMLLENLFQMQKKKSTLLTEAIARAKIREYETKKADPLVLASKRNEKRLAKSWEQFYLR
jgi:hypothetical protein